MPQPSIEDLKSQLAQLQQLHADGVLSQTHYDEARRTLEQRLIETVMATPATPAAPVTPVAAVSAVATPPLAPMAPTAEPVSAPTHVAAASAPRAKPSKGLLAALALGVVVLAGAGYRWKGSPELLRGNPPADLAAQSAEGGNGGENGGAPHTTSAEQIAAMTDKLVARLKEQPNDFEGWSMLARTYGVLQRHTDALKAYEKALALHADDAALLADYADTLAVTKGGDLSGEPLKALEKAIKLDPANLKALALLGTHAFNTKDYAGASKLWEKVVQIGPPDNFFVKQIIPGIVEARRLGGLPPLPSLPSPSATAPQAQPLDGAGKATPTLVPAANGAKVSGTVTLSAAVRGKVQPTDTVFITARAPNGSRMPLAVLRRQVKDLPLSFTLDDSQAMSPSSALSSAKEVVVTARISRSGNAMPQAGDWQGQSGVVAVGSGQVQLEISNPVKP